MTMLARAGLRPMRPRDPQEPHRTASTLELFFDLTFVVGVSVAAHELLHAEETGLAIGIVRFLIVFFAVWWAWVNFTWFASAFDTDDWLYRGLTIVQMAGVLITAAGMPAVAEDGDFTVGIVGYLVMRLALVAQWLRAARHPAFRTTALRYAGAVSLVQALWVVLLLLPPAFQPPALVVLVVAELAVPAWAEHARTTPFHRHHIAERYGLFTLIVLGEGLLGVTNALIDAQETEARAGGLVVLGLTALVIIAGLWWLYFSRESSVLDAGARWTFGFGYLHYVVFGSAAALAAGIELSIAQLAETAGHGEEAHAAPMAAVQAAATVPVALFVLATWFTVVRQGLGPAARIAVPVIGLLIGCAAFVPAGLQVAAVLVVIAVVVVEVDARRSVA
jgi:low temperature requirement protein LtrA